MIIFFKKYFFYPDKIRWVLTHFEMQIRESYKKLSCDALHS